MRNGLLLLLAVGHGAAFNMFDSMFDVSKEEIRAIKLSIAAANATSLEHRSVDALQEVESRRRLETNPLATVIATLKCKPMDACGGHQSCDILPEPDSGSIDFFEIQSSKPIARYKNKDGQTYTFTYSGECQMVYTFTLWVWVVPTTIDVELCLEMRTTNPGFFERETTLTASGVVNHKYTAGFVKGKWPRAAVIQEHTMKGKCTLIGNIILVVGVPLAIIVIISITVYCCKKKSKKEQKAVSPAASPQPMAAVPTAVQGVPMQPMHEQTSPPPVAKAGSSGIDVAKLKELKELLDAGVLTQAEFDAQKKELLEA